MSDAYFNKVLRSAHTFLSRWSGADGELWELTFSHRSLQILLRHPLREGNLLIACIDPHRITGPIRWKNSNIEVLLHQLQSENDCGFCIVDPGAGLEVVCGAVEIKENVKLY